MAIVSGPRAPGTAIALNAATTLGRRGVRAIAVDVDATAPAIHAAAGVDRRPTLAAVAHGRPVAAAVHPHPEVASVGIVPAPPDPGRVAADRALARLREAGASILVDCPLGAGPIVADALRAVDRALVIAVGPADDAATVDGGRLATRLGVPEVAVAALDRRGPGRDRADAIARAAALATEPSESRRPDGSGGDLQSDATRPKAKSYGTTMAISHERMVGRLETGIDVLDRKLDGGLPPGCVVAFTASPASQSELLLYELTAARGTLYLATERSDDVVRHTIESSQARVGSPTIRRVSTDDPLEEAHRLVGALPDGANLIVDTMDVIERTDLDAYRSFLNDLKAQMLETGGIAVLHCLKDDAAPENRRTTLHMADAVFDLQTDVGATEIENYMTIPKFRAGGAPTERIKLELTEQVAIDTSRDIA